MPENINKGSLVMFRNRIQSTSYGMRVDQIKDVEGVRQCKIDGLWWYATSLMLFSEWKKRQSS